MSINATVRSFVVDNFLFGEGSGLKGDSSFLGEGIIDSTGILELVAFLESQWGVRVEDEELIPENLDSIDKVAAFVEKKKGFTPILVTPTLVNA
jgi:acyl carrier protein